MFFKIGVLKNFAVFTGKHLSWSHFLIKSLFIKKRPQRRYFPVNIAKFLRTAFFIEHLQWLLLNIDTNRLRFHRFLYDFEKVLGMEQ